MRYPHIVFDVDNTLTDTTEAVFQGLLKAIWEVKGERWERERLAPIMGIPGIKAFEVLGIQSPEEIFRIYPLWEKYMIENQHMCYVYQGIIPLLEYLKLSGRSLGIITSKTDQQFDSTFKPFGITDYFDTVITADDTLKHKPDPSPLNAYLWLNSLTPGDALYVGDSVYDMQCAASAGVDSALALWGCHNPKVISSAYRFASPPELMNWFKNDCPPQNVEPKLDCS